MEKEKTTIKQAEELIASFQLPETKIEGYLFLWKRTNDKKYYYQFRENLQLLPFEEIILHHNWIIAMTLQSDNLIEEIITYLRGGWVDDIESETEKEEKLKELRRRLLELIERLCSSIHLIELEDLVFALLKLPYIYEEEKLKFIKKVVERLKRLA